MSYSFWFEDPMVLFDAQQFHHILPRSGMTFVEKLNASVRFFLYLGVFLAVATRRASYLFFGIVAMAVSIALARFYENRQEALDAYLNANDVRIEDGGVCVRPTVDNPFMNPNVVDMQYRPQRPPACDVTESEMQNTIEHEFNARFAKDFDDVYGRNGNSHAFYTVPNTQVPNDQASFAEWLYGTGPTCKEGSGDACQWLNYRHVANA